MGSKAQANELELLKIKKTVHLWHLFAKVCLSLLRCVTVVAVAYFAWKTIIALAGRQTDANIALSGTFDLKFLANRYASQIIFAIFGSGGVLYGLRQRSLCKKTTKKLKRLEKLEKTVDPDRTSSDFDEFEDDL